MFTCANEHAGIGIVVGYMEVCTNVSADAAPYLLHSIPSLLTSLVHVTWRSRALFTLLYVYTIVYVHRGGHQSCW